MNTRILRQKARFFMTRQYMRVYSLFHPVQKKVLFESFNGKQYSDSPRAVSERMHEMYPDFELVWAFQAEKGKSPLVPGYVRQVDRKSMAYYREFATAFAFVTNEGMISNVVRRKNQFIVQTWHGDRAIKKYLYDLWQDKKRPIPLMDEYITDLCVAASDSGEEGYRSAFRYPGEILKVGMPRNDVLVRDDPEEKRRVRESLHIPMDKKVVLYAPTFRDRLASKQNVNVDLFRVAEVLGKDDTVVLLRAHPASRGLQYPENGRFIDVSSYPDMADLLLISDILITDYSSSAGDFAVRDKPVILAMFDREEYEKNSRSLRINLDESGYLVAENQEQLEELLLKPQEVYTESCRKIRAFYGYHESGHSSEAVCERISKEYSLRVLNK